MLANNIQDYIKRTIYYDHVGLTLGMKSWSKIQKLINVIHHIKRLNKKKIT